MSIGDIIKELSYNLPLGTNQIWESQKIVMSEYNSISLVFYADETSRVTINWSADGTNWDFVKTYVLERNTQDQISMITYSKWCYITIQNIALPPQTILRSNVYGSTSNNAVSSSVVGTTANTLPEFSIMNSLDYNAFKSQHTESWTPEFVYNFNSLNSGTGYTARSGKTGATQYGEGYGYSDLGFRYSSATDAINVSAPRVGVDPSGVIVAESVNFPNQWSTISNNFQFLKLYPNIGARVQFTSAFKRDREPTDGGTGTPDLWAGCGYIEKWNNGSYGASSPIKQGLFFGFEGTRGPTGGYPEYRNAFGIHYVNNGSYQFISQNNWNIDRCDNGGPIPPMPLIDNEGWALPHTYAFSFSPNSSVLCYIQNPLTNKMTLVHVIYYVTNSQIFSVPRVSPVIYSRVYDYPILSVSTTPIRWVKMYSYMSGYEQTNIIPRSIQYSFQGRFTNGPIGTNYLPVFTMVTGTTYVLAHIVNDTTIHSSGLTGVGYDTTNNYVIVKPDTLVINSSSSDDANMLITIRANAGVTGLDEPLAQYANKGYSPIVYYINAGVAGNPILNLDLNGSEGTLLYSLRMGNTQVTLDLRPYKYLMYPNNSITILGRPAESNKTFNYHLGMCAEEYH